MKTNTIFTFISMGLILILLSCSHSIKTKRNSSNQTLTAKRDSSSYVLIGDSIHPPIKYNMEEMGDYLGGTGVPLQMVVDTYLDKKYLHFIDGRRVEEDKKDKVLKKLKKKVIGSLAFIPPSEAVELYGQRAKHGAVIIETKKED